MFAFYFMHFSYKKLFLLLLVLVNNNTVAYITKYVICLCDLCSKELFSLFLLYELISKALHIVIDYLTDTY